VATAVKRAAPEGPVLFIIGAVAGLCGASRHDAGAVEELLAEAAPRLGVAAHA